MSTRCVLAVFGTRADAIKMAPVVQELEKYPDKVTQVVCVTAQHREILSQVLGVFKIKPNIDLDLMEERQTLSSFTARAMTNVTGVLVNVKPNWVLVQGDTSTALVTALAAFYERIPIAHIEAGLRTGDRYSPFPEEINRRLISVLATLNFAPTEAAAAHLRAEGIGSETIHITGNTVTDALQWVLAQPSSSETQRLYRQIGLERGADASKLILVTAHRRENWGQPLENICCALKDLAERNPLIEIVYPVHPNPHVREHVYRLLCDVPRVHLIDPLPYEAFVHLMGKAFVILSDSGGIQEEAPALGKPVLVLRNGTERPEGVNAGVIKLVGTDPHAIVAETEYLLHHKEAYDRMAHPKSLYGDGHASERIVKALVERL